MREIYFLNNKESYITRSYFYNYIFVYMCCYHAPSISIYQILINEIF